MQPSTLLVFAAACLGLASAAAIPEPETSPSTVTEISIADIPASIESKLQKRACFQTGETWGSDRNLALDWVRITCRDNFQRTYQRGQGFRVCRNLNGKHVVFSVGLFGPNAGATRYLSADECYGGLSSEVNSCSRGGETTYGNWYYR